MTATHAAAKHAHLECFMYLFEHGASLQIRDRNGATALDFPDSEDDIKRMLDHRTQVSAAFPKKILYIGHRVVLMPLT